MKSSLQRSINNTNFLTHFYFDLIDYNHGYVQYVPPATAQSNHMLDLVTNNQIRLGANASSSGPVKSIKAMSSFVMEEGSLWLVDVAHFPTGCGQWAAFWSYGPNWPNGGEIDTIEYVNLMTEDQTTLHTDPGCVQPADSTVNKYVGSTDCNYMNGYYGCSLQAPPNSVSNSNGGGVYATLWNSTDIMTFFFPRGSIPTDITGKAPQPDSWSKFLYADFKLTPAGGSCSADHFQSQQIVININFCGDWAGNVFINDCGSAVCNHQTNSEACCRMYLNSNYATVNQQTYWTLNYIDVYKLQY